MTSAGPTTPPGEIFRSENLVARMRQHRGGAGGEVCVVTFDSYSDLRSLPRPAFAEDFLRAIGVDAVHIHSFENDWYHYDELLEMLAKVKDALAPYVRVYTYGSSMGGYAAIRFGGALGAKAAIAISPQYSINPAIVPWEIRWAHDSQRIRFVLDQPEVAAYISRAIVFYDPVDADRRHVDMLGRHTELVRVGMRHSGHPSGGFIADTKLLRPIITDILAERFDATAFLAKARAARLTSPHYMRHLSDRTRNADRAIRFAIKSLELLPEHPLAKAQGLSHVGCVLTKHGRHAEAREKHEAAIALSPQNPILIYRYTDALEAGGDLKAALAAIESLMASDMAADIYRPRLEHLRQRIEDEARPKTNRQPQSVLTAGAATAAGENSARPWRWYDVLGGGMPAAHPQNSAEQHTRLAHMRHRAHLLTETLSRAHNSIRPVVSDGTRFTMRTVRQSMGVLRRAVSARLAELPLDLRITQTPAPPAIRHAWQRHLDIIAAQPKGPVDLVLIGDSHAHYWPEALWGGWRIYNAGVLADKTQHTLWRLDEMAGRVVDARFVLIVLGTNNLGADDTPAGIEAGLGKVAAQAQRLAPKARVMVLELPPCGPQFGFRAEDRKATNLRLRYNPNFSAVSPEQVLTTNPGAYKDDHIHFSDAGYALLTELVKTSAEKLI